MVLFVYRLGFKSISPCSSPLRVSSQANLGLVQALASIIDKDVTEEVAESQASEGFLSRMFLVNLNFSKVYMVSIPSILKLLNLNCRLIIIDLKGAYFYI